MGVHEEQMASCTSAGKCGRVGWKGVMLERAE